MPHKRNPVAAIAVLGCTRRAPGLLATLAAAAEQEHQRAAGAWHAEWEPLADLLRLTGSAASWAADLLGGLEVDPARMRANLDAARGLPLAEHVAALLAPALGRIAAHDLLAAASAAPWPAGHAGRGAAQTAGGGPDRRGRHQRRAGDRGAGPGRLPGCGRGLRGRGPGRAREPRPLGSASWPTAAARCAEPEPGRKGGPWTMPSAPRRG